MNEVEEAVFVLEEFLRWNKDKYETKVDSSIKILLADYKKVKAKNRELQERLDFYSSIKDCDEEFEREVW